MVPTVYIAIGESDRGRLHTCCLHTAPVPSLWRGAKLWLGVAFGLCLQLMPWSFSHAQCVQDGGGMECRAMEPQPWVYQQTFDLVHCWPPDQTQYYSTEAAAFARAQREFQCAMALMYVCTSSIWPGPSWTSSGSCADLSIVEHKAINYEWTGSSPLGNPSCDYHHDFGGSYLTRTRGTTCPAGWNPHSTCSTATTYCYRPAKPQVCTTGNPCVPNSGAKLDSSVDYAGAGPFPINLTRHYSSDAFYRPFAATSPDTGMGIYWRLSYHRWVVAATGSAGTTMFVTLGDGDYRWFRQSGGVWVGRADMPERLTQLTGGGGQTTGWQFKTASDDLEAYDANGRLLSITNRAGLSQAMGYDAQARLTSVTDSFGRQLVLGYNTSGKIATLTDPAGRQYTYAYNGAGDIQSIAYPNQTVRQYLYEYTDPSDPRTAFHLMTGIVDENGNRYATYGYDNSGRVTSELHGTNADQLTLAYTSPYATTTITDALGTVRQLSFTTINGISKSAGVSQPCASCGITSSAIAYDANGNVASRSDFNNKKVCYAYDLSRNLETSRLEGALSTETCSTVLANPPNRPDVRKITTTWNALYRVPATLNEPAPGGTKTTTFTYDASGNLTQKSITAPKNDGSGGVTTRTWGWT
jgi:YD repeat-containing protein